MAIVNLDSAKLTAKINEVNVGTLTASTTDGLEYTVNRPDDKTILVVYNAGSSAANLTIKAPKKKCYAGVVADKVVSVAAGKLAVVQVETARYMDAETKKITFGSASADLKALVTEFKN